MAIFAVACTNEDEVFESNKTKDSINQKTSTLRKYASYEEINCTDEVLQENLDLFNSSINGNGIMPSFDAKMALLVMETHFNYGIVVKIPRIKDAIEYDKMNFTFTVRISNNIIEGQDIKDAYSNFVANVVANMEGRNYELSDMYVEDISTDYIKFGLDMGPSTNKDLPDQSTPAVSIVKSIGDPISVPSSVYSEWTNMPEIDLLNQYGTFENIVHKYSFKWLRLNTSPGKQYVYVQQRSDYAGNAFEFITAQSGDPVVWNNNDLNNTLIPAAISTAQNACSGYWSQFGYVLINYDPRVRKTPDYYVEQPIPHTTDMYKLRVARITCALLREVNLYDMHMAAITNSGF